MDLKKEEYYNYYQETSTTINYYYNYQLLQVTHNLYEEIFLLFFCFVCYFAEELTVFPSLHSTTNSR